jgi:hypothetical protein
MHPEFGPNLTVVISVLQTALTPAVLLVAVGSLLNVLTAACPALSTAPAICSNCTASPKARRISGW